MPSMVPSVKRSWYFQSLTFEFWRVFSVLKHILLFDIFLWGRRKVGRFACHGKGTSCTCHQLQKFCHQVRDCCRSSCWLTFHLQRSSVLMPGRCLIKDVFHIFTLKSVLLLTLTEGKSGWLHRQCLQLSHSPPPLQFAGGMGRSWTLEGQFGLGRSFLPCCCFCESEKSKRGIGDWCSLYSFSSLGWRKLSELFF